MRIDDNGYIRFTGKELAILNKTNPTLYSITEWVANNPEIKNGTRNIMKVQNTITNVGFMGNFGRCPTDAIAGAYCKNVCNYCGGFMCSIGYNGKSAHPCKDNVGCLELRWKDILENTTYRYKHITYVERYAMFDSKPIVVRPCIKVI